METAVMKLSNGKFLALFLLGFTCNERDNWSIIYQHDLSFIWYPERGACFLYRLLEE